MSGVASGSSGGIIKGYFPEGSLLHITTDTVQRKLADFKALSDHYGGVLTASLGAIANVKVDDVAPPPIFHLPQPQWTAGTTRAVPDFRAQPLQIPSLPAAPDFARLFAGLNLDVAQGDLPPLPQPPRVELPDAPLLDTGHWQTPQRPDADMRLDMPDAPDFVLPDVPVLERLNLPEFRFPELPDFQGVPPNVDDITLPDVFFNWREPDYRSELLDDLKGQIRTMMGGGTGLPAPVEDALFARTRDRLSVETAQAVQEITGRWASRGYSLPQGALDKQLAAVREQGADKAAELNRDILTQAAQWEIENLRFAVVQGLALEQLLSNLHENTAKRLFEAARFAAEASVRVFDARIALFNAQNAAFGVMASVFKTRLEASLGRLQAYKTAVEAQAVLGQVNQQQVDVYRARLDGVRLSADVYKTLVSAQQVRAEMIGKQFEAYRTDVQAYAERVQAEKLKFDAYDSRMRGEKTKVEVYDANVRAYAATVQAVSERSGIKIKEKQLQLGAAETQIKAFGAELEAHKAQLDASLAEAKYQTDVFRTRVDAWKAETSVAAAEAEMQSRFADMNTRTAVSYAQMRISEYEAQMRNAVQKAQIALEGSKALGQYTAQLAAGALSAQHVSASMSASSSLSSSNSKSESVSTSHNYTY